MMKKVSLAGLLLLSVVLLGSCLKHKDSYYDSPEFQNAAAVSIINGAPLGMPLDIQFDGTQRWLLNEFNYTYRTNYTRVYSGDRKLYVFNRGESKALISKNMTFEPRKRYSVFIVDTLSKMDAILVRDSVMEPKGDSVLLRFANMSPDAGSIDLYIQGNTKPIAQNIGYKNVSTFVSFKSDRDIKFEARAAGTNTVLATSDVKNLFNGNQYTIWTTGFKSMNTTNGKLIVELMAHYY
ncbi:DUF4397 domain-containing protein [Niabella pedocola]|uniref:DUF4397 domain-containing protein n=1 Tax=Niabella pedocola TaxID=1752077 RepID=A0ABS8PK83_9BACT|nr:DUF4397 domain-containing protein [Niabella pedocola]MCD2421494.1 DUF4397 domain-containing protein [Niabella pedocola]